MSAFYEFVQQLRSILSCSLQRAGLVLQGQPDWVNTRMDELVELFKEQRCLKLGGEAYGDVGLIDVKKGRHFLGQECHLVIVDLSDELDADNLNAVLGTLVGGGLLVFIETQHHKNKNLAERWLSDSLNELIMVIQGDELPVLPKVERERFSPDYQQQSQVVRQIKHVSEGHSKRPLVLTADRGRGKSSALGIAAAELMACRSLRIVVTAPSSHAVQAIFYHARRVLGMETKNQSARQLSRDKSELMFIPPDELLRSSPEADLLLVDEASSIPVPILQQLSKQYNRVVFSTTIHGYEGCGRGFTLKFMKWLKNFRPHFSVAHLSQPIRWAEDDGLERWQFRTFLLNAELPELPDELDFKSLKYRHVEKQALFASPAFFSEIFALLTQAHYQTSPNDLMRILSDEKISVFIAEQDNHCLGCILAVTEGNLSLSAIEKIQVGTHRPKGQMVPITLINQLGIPEAGTKQYCRVMRIVVHPQLQRRGLGQLLLKSFIGQCHSDYIATSFGATDELLHFWIQQNFYPVKIGSKRDQSSGCYSVLMMHMNSRLWPDQLGVQFSYYFLHALKSELRFLEPQIVRHLLSVSEPVPVNYIPLGLLKNYASGGANYESIAVWIHALIGNYPELPVSDLMILKVLQDRSWSDVASLSGLSGRKAIERELRRETKSLIDDLQCK